MTGLVLFCGAGGSCRGLHQAGVDVLAAYDNDVEAVTTRNRGVLDLRGFVVDLSTYNGALLPGVDLWWASPPCQPFSAAGKRNGASDDRNGYPWILRLVDEARAAGRGPRHLVIENVVGLTLHRSRAWYRKHGQSACTHRGGKSPRPSVCPGCYWGHVVIPDLESRFGRVQWRIIDAADFGVPQHRKRVITVCSVLDDETTPYHWPEPTHGNHPDLLPYVTMGEALGLTRRHVGGGAGNAGPFVMETGHPAWFHRVSPVDQPSRTIGTKRNASIFLRPEGKRRRLTIEECGILQDFPADWPWFGKTKSSRYRQAGNAVPATMARVVVLPLT